MCKDLGPMSLLDRRQFVFQRQVCSVQFEDQVAALALVTCRLPYTQGALTS